MSDINEIVDSIDWKLRKLVLQKNELAKQLLLKDEQVALLQEQVQQQSAEIECLKQEKQINKLTDIINNSSDNKQYKELIDDLLRKINRSISIISSKNIKE